MVGREKGANFQTVLQEVELLRINREANPDYFYESSYFEEIADEKGFTNFLTVKNPELVNIKDSIDSAANEILTIFFRRCVNETRSVLCASDVEFEEYIGNHSVMLSSLINFIEYEEVEPGVGPVKRILRTILYESL